MKLWEYKTLILGSLFKEIKEDDLQLELNKLGLEGWELVSSSGYDLATKQVFIFKRELKQSDKD